MMNPGAAACIKLIGHPVRFRLFLLSKLPSAYFSGVRVKEISEQRCIVTVPYKWFSQNPFRSTYFACQSMAAEMSTGALAMVQVYQRKPSVSMLVTKVESEYFKKATGLTSFTCEDGELIGQAVQDSIDSGDGKTVRVHSLGRNEGGETISEFFITWSFKAKKAN